MDAINLRDLADRLNNLDEDQLKLIREQLEALCPSYEDQNLAEVVEALFTVTNENQFSKVKDVKEAVDIAHSLPNIQVDDNVTLPLVVLHFLADLFDEPLEHPIHIFDCELYASGLCDITIKATHPVPTTKQYLVGSDDEFAEELKRRYREDDDLTYLMPSFVYDNLSECNVPKQQFCDALGKIADEFVRADVYRMVLNPDDYDGLVSEAISTDGIALCFHAVRNVTKEFDFRGETIYHIEI